jgi:hypothetical protein
MEASRQEWDAEIRIYAREYRDDLEDFENSFFHLHTFSGVLLQAKKKKKKISKICNIIFCSKKQKNLNF